MVIFLLQFSLKEAKCKQPHKWYFTLKITSFSDAFIAKTIRLHNTVVLHRSPPKYSNQENWSSTHFYWFKSPTWSRKSLSGEVWTPVQAPNMASNHGTIVEMSVFKGFKLWSLSELRATPRNYQLHVEIVTKLPPLKLSQNEALWALVPKSLV